MASRQGEEVRIVLPAGGDDLLDRMRNLLAIGFMSIRAVRTSYAQPDRRDRRYTDCREAEVSAGEGIARM
jgi:hypothetical protein